MNNNHRYLENNREDDVYSFASGIFKVNQIRSAMSYVIKSLLQKPVKEGLKQQGVEIKTEYYDSNTRSMGEHKWFGDGVDCELLRIGSDGWQKGKMRVRVIVEFCPDEPNTDEFPLDDIRQIDNYQNL